MIIQIDDWKFDVDLTATMAYSAAEAAEHCMCGYCRNFYSAVDKVYPNLRPFLAQFGIDIEAPDELCPYEPTQMDGYYAVSGKVLNVGKYPIRVDGLDIFITNSAENPLNTSCSEPYFILNTGMMDLPWVLEEPVGDVISTANEPSFLNRIWTRLLRSIPGT